jgi:ubiquinone/menaquinone biosynthesis C-methylase UbiE
MLILLPAGAYADSGESTRVADPDQHVCTLSGGYPYREKSDYVLDELDLEPGDVVADIGAGDGWWAERMAEKVGPEGVIHAGEVDEKKVDQMKEELADLPQVKPYLCPTDGTGLPEDSCDLAFLSKTYHHLPDEGRVDYWRHLREVLKPTGRVCVIERHPGISEGRSKQHAWSPALLMEQAEEGGWIAVRYELISGTYHFLAIFVQRDLFPAEPPRKKREAGAKP